MRLIPLFCACLLAATPAIAQDRETIGVGRLFTNDYFGDGDDRWRSGSYSISIIRGSDTWEGQAPTSFGSLLEYRLRSEIIAPSDLNGVDAGDRAYVGALTAGLHTHFSRNAWDLSAGVDLVIVGDQTGLSELQDGFHNLLGAPRVSNAVDDNQLSNAVYPTLVAEGARTVSLGETVDVRPFVEAQIGVEDFVRVGADVFIGNVLRGDLWVRENSSGQLYSGVQTDRAGLGFVLGADYTFLEDSAYFPTSFGTVAEDERLRVRAGLHTRLGDDASYFYGLTYLGEEFEGQAQGQVVGSVKLNFNF